MKHMAFKEEQECLTVYVTQMDNPLIQYDEKINRIYIDYAPSVMEHLEKSISPLKQKMKKWFLNIFARVGKKYVKVRKQ